MTTFIFSLLTVSFLCFGSPIAWIDHVMDFHLEVQKPEWYGQAEMERDDKIWNEISSWERDNDRSNDHERDTTCSPDRDR